MLVPLPTRTFFLVVWALLFAYATPSYSAPELLDRARELLGTDFSGWSRWKESLGLLQFTQALGIKDVSDAYEIAESAFEKEDFIRLNWVKPELMKNLDELREFRNRLRTSSDSSWKPRKGTYARFQDLSLVADLADEFTDGSIDALLGVIPSVLSPLERASLHWPDLPAALTSNHLRLREDVFRFPERYSGVMAAVRAAIITDYRVPIAMQLLELVAKEVGLTLPPIHSLPDMYAGDLLTALDLVREGAKPFLAQYQGLTGLERLANNYFNGNMRLAYFSIVNVLKPADFRKLKWDSVPKPTDVAPQSPFSGTRVPIPLPDYLKATKLSPEQSWRARQYLVWQLHHGRHPIVSDWSKGDELRERLRFYGLGDFAEGEELESSSIFKNPNFAVEGIAQLARTHRIALDWLEAPIFKHLASDSVRRLMQDSGVSRYLTWILVHPFQRLMTYDWGTLPNQIGVDLNRFLGESIYAPGGKNRERRIFGERKEAFDEIRSRAQLLGLRLESKGNPVLKRWLNDVVLNGSGQRAQAWAVGVEGLRVVASMYFSGDTAVAIETARLHIRPELFRSLNWENATERAWKSMVATNPKLYKGPHRQTLRALHELQMEGFTSLQAQLLKQYLTWYVVHGRVPRRSDFGIHHGSVGFGRMIVDTHFGSHQQLILLAKREGARVGILVNILAVLIPVMSPEFFLASRLEVVAQLHGKGITADTVTAQEVLNLKPSARAAASCTVVIRRYAGRPLFESIEELRDFMRLHESKSQN